MAFSDEPIRDDHGECPYREAADAFCSILNKADHAPMIVETWDCPECGLACWEAHRWSEVLFCGKCKHRVASKVVRYVTLLDMLPDLRDKGASKSNG